MAKDVKSDLRYVLAEKLKKKWHTKIWSISKSLNLDSVYFFWGNRTFGKSLTDGGCPTNPVENWDIAFRDGTELNELQHQAVKLLRNANINKYKNLKLKMGYDEVLGDIELELVNGAGKRLSAYTKKAVIVMFRKGDVGDSLFSDFDYEIKTINKVDADLTKIESYHNLCDLGVAITGIETKEECGILTNRSISYYRLLTDTPSNMNKFVKTALEKQPSSILGDLSIGEINDVLDKRDKKVLPKYINGLRFIDTGEPYLKLGDLTNAFSVSATNEARLAKVIFGRRRDLSKIIRYEEIYDSIRETDGLYGTLASKQKNEVDRKIRDDAIRLNHRIGAMLGLGEEKALVTVEDGIAINHHLLKPKN